MLLDFTAFWALIWGFGLLSEPLQATIDVGFARHYRIWSLVCALELALLLGSTRKFVASMGLAHSDSCQRLSEPVQATNDVGFARLYRIWSLVCALELALLLGSTRKFVASMGLAHSDSCQRLSEPVQATNDVGFARLYRIWSLVYGLELARLLGRAEQVEKYRGLYRSGCSQGQLSKAVRAVTVACNAGHSST